MPKLLCIVKRATFSVIASLATISFSQAQVAQSSPGQEPAIAAKPLTDDERVSDFLSRKRQRQAERAAILQRRGIGGEEVETRQLYRSLNVVRPRPSANISASNLSALNDALGSDAVQLIQSLGIKPQRIRRLAVAGFDPLVAATAYVRGTATISQQALLADVVAVAKVTAVRNELLGDGFRSTVMFDVIEAVSGRAKGGQLALREMSGLDESGRAIDVSSDLTPTAGETYLVMLSNGLYEQTSQENGGNSVKSPVDYHVLFGSAYTVEGDKIQAAYSGADDQVSLSGLKNELAAMKRGREAADAQPK